jgi:predicted RNase H-like HicB family nuclease
MAYTLSMSVGFTAVFKKVPEGYAAYVEELPGANTQGATIEEARENLREAVELVLDANRALARNGHCPVSGRRRTGRRSYPASSRRASSVCMFRRPSAIK